MFSRNCCCLVTKSGPTLCNSMDCSPLSMGFPRQEYWSGLPFPSPGISVTQGSKVDSLLLSCLGNPRIAKTSKFDSAGQHYQRCKSFSYFFSVILVVVADCSYGQPIYQPQVSHANTISYCQWRRKWCFGLCACVCVCVCLREGNFLGIPDSVLHFSLRRIGVQILLYLQF